MAFYSVFLEAIPAYTGLSPVAFFTTLALMVGVYHLVCALFVSDPPPPNATSRSAMEMMSMPVNLEPVQLGDVTEEELRAYDGSDPTKPLLMAIKGQIYDVTRSRMFYGPGGHYALFAGRDASRALALMSFDPKDLTGDIEGLSPSELETLQDWEYKFMEKYVTVGQIVEKKEKREGDVNGKESENSSTENLNGGDVEVKR
ncbi:membrane steroid-binding protein 2 isoform X2 [Amborella trichopoda]|uniref:Cytochrome b5 heme-binding domain-containing protein n=1 Tax=Amborella trichopoda TaxID=13333 RepID=W1NQ71_AMBTC|nr:membrane steroid-binding protein 2 isoform X2 [Amborella trichopoda]ERM99056.1 hypothetical protein AMTR_s00101p00080290 [Amborella trichopoda]|eukprot:XP_006836203.1 membrane steroid-binding protein 2 isoform X2 [Amborella trichopoda]